MPVRFWAIGVVLSLWLSLIAGVASAFTPTSEYRALKINGWTVLVAPEIVRNARDYNRLISKVSTQTGEIVARLPARHVKVMQKARIWLEPDTTFHRDDNFLGLYLVGRQMIFQQKLNPQKLRGVVIVDTFAKRRAPTLLLHEMAHVFQDRKLSFSERRIEKMYEAFVRSSAKATDRCGRTRPAYALTNMYEFFARFTEAYVVGACGYPYDRKTIAARYPEMAQFLAKAYGS